MKYVIILFLLLTSICLEAQIDTVEKPSYFISYVRHDLDTLNYRINAGLDLSVTGYQAAQYFTVNYDTASTRYWAEIPVKENDSRDPQRFMTDMERSALVTKTYMLKQRLIR